MEKVNAQGAPPGDPLQIDTRLLVPLFKAGRKFDNALAPLHFDTAIGKLRISRKSDPPLLSTDIVDLARRGILSKSLESGSTIRAPDLAPAVDAITTKIFLNDTYEWRTRPISLHANTSLEPNLDIRDLIFVFINKDELPSYHFWINHGDARLLIHKGVAAEHVDAQDQSRPTLNPQSEASPLSETKKNSLIQTNVELPEKKQRKPTDFEMPSVIAQLLHRQSRASIPSTNRENPEVDNDERVLAKIMYWRCVCLYLNMPNIQ